MKTKKSTLVIAVVLLLAVMAGIGVGLRFAKTDDAFAFDVKPIRSYEYKEIERVVKEPNNILNAAVWGLWTTDLAENGLYGPDKSYDNKQATRWNPQANTDYLGEPSIIYLLDGYYNMESWEMLFSRREYFFKLYVSKDGEDFKLLKEVTKDNYIEFFVIDGEKYICKLEDLDADNILYVKVTFTGANDVNNNPFVNLHEAKCVGEKVADGPQEMPEFDNPYKVEMLGVESYKVIGSWKNSLEASAGAGPKLSNDGNIYSKWNPEPHLGFEGDPGIIYKLKDPLDIKKMQIYVGKCPHYFDIYVSQNGTSYKQVAAISYANQDEAYKEGLNNNYICTMDGLSLKQIKYIKLIFTGRSDSIAFINLMEITASSTGASNVDTSWMMRKEPISKHPWILTSEIIGTWEDKMLSNQNDFFSYDGDTKTKWNPYAKEGYVGEPGIIYTLRKPMALNEIKLTIGKAHHYFNVYVSQDGKSYTPVAYISSANAYKVYTKGSEDNLICTLDSLGLQNIKYLKITFTGRELGSRYVNMMEVDLSEKGATGKDNSWMLDKLDVDSYRIVGSWKNDMKNTPGAEPEKSYDGNISSKWNPEANLSFAGAPGIIYKLKNPLDIKKMQIQVGKSAHYFDVYVSRDDSTYKQIATITYANQEEAYTEGKNENLICTLDGLSLEKIKYIKLVFTGRSDGVAFVNLMEVIASPSGSSNIDTSWMMRTEPVSKHPWIASSEIVGEWAETVVGSFTDFLSYDGDVTTKWNANAKLDYSGEPGIVFTLKNKMTLKKLQFTIGAATHYFNVYASADGSTYNPVAYITSVNADKAYTKGTNNNLVCTLDGLNIENTKYVKIVFTGREAGSTYVNLVEVDLYETGTEGLDISWMLPTSPEEKPGEEVQAAIIGSTFVGTWAAKDSGNVAKSYDKNVATKWNPWATDYASGEGIVYTLDSAYDLSKLELVFGSRYYYFKLSTSADGTEYSKVASVTPESQSTYYTAGYTCTFDNLSSKGVKYIKIEFTGDSANNKWINLFEVSAFGIKGENVEVQSAITGYTLVGAWAAQDGGSVVKSYDKNTATKWNPNATDYASGEGIAYTLDKAYNLTRIQAIFGSRYYYFKVYASSDGVEYQEIATVNSGNQGTYYTNGYTCVLNNLIAENVKYIKIEFTGDSQNNKWINLFELEAYGK